MSLNRDLAPGASGPLPSPFRNSSSLSGRYNRCCRLQTRLTPPSREPPTTLQERRRRQKQNEQRAASLRIRKINSERQSDLRKRNEAARQERLTHSLRLPA